MTNRKPGIKSKTLDLTNLLVGLYKLNETNPMMSNKLKTLSESQLETLISKSLSEYLNEEVNCNIHYTDIPNIDDVDKIEHSNKRTMSFRADLSYEETDSV